ncbi:TPA: hypothetical protein ACU8BE_002194 [Neisseria subflava]
MFKRITLIVTILIAIILSYSYFRYSAYCYYKEKTLSSYKIPSDGDQCARFNVSENKNIVVCLDNVGNFLSIDGLYSGIYLYDDQGELLSFYYLHNEVWQSMPLDLNLNKEGIFNLGLYAQTESFSINSSIFHRIEAKFIDTLCYK